MEITINAAWLFVAITALIGIYCVGHFRGWYEAHNDFYNENKPENE